MTEDHMEDGPAAEAETPPPPAAATAAEPTLKEQLAALEAQQAAAKKAQVDANIADLEKLIAAADKAQADYDKAFEALEQTQKQHEADAKTLKASLTAALQDKGLSEAKVKSKVQEAITALSTAWSNFETLKTAQETAAATAKASQEAEAAAKAKVDLWSKPVEGITARQQAAEKSLKEVRDLRNGTNTRSEAYWKLVLGGTPSVDGPAFANLLIGGQPEVLQPGDLRERIRTAWNAFTAARTQTAADRLALEAADAALKEADAEVKALEKDLIKAITDSLAAQEAAAGSA